MKNQIKKYGSITLFILLFPYICGVFLNKINISEIKKEESGEYKVEVKSNAGLEKMSLEHYIEGVLATVIPIDYEQETLKAQAVILRTDIIKTYLEQGKGNRTIEAEKLNYEYWDTASLKLLWGGMFEENFKKIENAVKDTEDMVLTYQGIPMEVPFFALSAGNTRNGNEVFHSPSYEYLQSVACSNDILDSNYRQRKFFSKDEIEEKLNMQFLSLEEIRILTLDSIGYVMEMKVGDETMQGEDFRKQLNLPSSNFKMEILDHEICFTTNGIGHGLGLSQYGANQMSLEKKTFLEILTYFYSGVQIQKQ